MRVGDLTLYDSLEGTLDTQQASIGNLDTELSSGLSIQKPSDNPVGAVNALADQSQLSQLTATQSSATTASTWLGIAGNSASSVLSVLQTARTLMLQALNTGGETSNSYQAIATQVQSLVSQLVSLGNSSYAGSAIFAGTAGVQSPYSASGAYSGNESNFTIQVGPGAPTAVSVPGTSLFGGGTSGVQSVFTTLQNFVTHLAAGPGAGTANLQSDLNDLDANISLAENAATTIGEATDNVNAASTEAQSNATVVQGDLANTEDVDVASATTQLQSEMASYQAAMYAVSQTVPESLASFLH
jgi:flagellar hook-associated protein 3 FlgL